MKCSITGALVNVVLDILLVYGVEDYIPAMHLKGAAYASLAAQATMLLWHYGSFSKDTLSFKAKFHDQSSVKRPAVDGCEPFCTHRGA